MTDHRLDNLTTTPTATPNRGADATPDTGANARRRQGVFKRILWFFEESPAPVFFGAVTLVLGLAAFGSHIEQNHQHDWITQAPQIEHALNSHYVEHITYARSYIQHARGEIPAEAVSVDGQVRTDCIAVILDQTATTTLDAELRCENPITLTIATPTQH